MAPATRVEGSPARRSPARVGRLHWVREPREGWGAPNGVALARRALMVLCRHGPFRPARPLARGRAAGPVASARKGERASECASYMLPETTGQRQVRAIGVGPWRAASAERGAPHGTRALT